ncbi:MAG: 50S ribosomal protein L11 methyltransferase [Nevskia sp.]|nr:50S ribosomal protein L11 methyltransferase [Nevskia sp.]
MWIELRVATAFPEFAEEVLLAHGAVSVTLVDAADSPVLEPAPGATPLWPQTATCGLFDAQADLDAVAAALRELLPDGAQLGLSRKTVSDDDWIGAWRQHARPLRFGAADARGLWICPSGHAVDEAGAAVVQLDPGLAFGTGSHPSTALCLDWLAQHPPAGAQVLDYGCGSGILAIAALKLGAAHAQAVDIDPQALTACLGNAQVNGVADRIACAAAAQFDEQAVDETVDLVLANILARPLIELAPRLSRCLRRGGDIVLAGVMQSQSAQVRAAYAPWFDLRDDAVRDDWVRIWGRRNGARAG